MSDNTLALSGNVTRDPELRFTPGGQAVANFGVAVNRKWQNKSTQEWEEKVTFIDAVAWGALAENCAASVKKGDRVVLHGRIDLQTWETKEGEKRSKIEVVLEDIGPSLRWAQVDGITKNPKSGGGGYNQPPERTPDFDPGPSYTGDGDEEPF